MSHATENLTMPNGWLLPTVSNVRRIFRTVVALQLLVLGASVIHFEMDPGQRDFTLIAILMQVFVLLLQVALRAIAAAMDRNRALSLEANRQSHRQIDELFAMTDMLQAAETYEDASAVLMATARRLLPEYGVALYIFNNSRDRLDLARTWDMPEGYGVLETLSPNNCWALKRGKPHINSPEEASLCCGHHVGMAASVEIPMMACGQLHGLLVLACETGEGAIEQLKDIRRLGRALADSMSLALSNISLREKLRTQSLRDPLTGLYNRRYMEDALERFVSLGSRSGNGTGVIMIDLDNFKMLNDEHGHAKGDAVLRDVGGQLIGALRPTDVVCRYGGEELLVLLPNCSLEDASLKAEQLRERIQRLSDTHHCPITASLGVASVPETSLGASDAVANADEALYQAKRQGKNRVLVAGRRALADVPPPRLAATG